MQPGSALLHLLGGLRKGRQRRLKALIELGEARGIVLGQQVETAAGHVLEPLVGLYASESKGGPAFECKQVAGVAKEVRDDLIGCGRRRAEGSAGCLALGIWRRGYVLCTERTGQQPGHRQDAGPAGGRAGLLADQGAHLLADSFAKRNFAGRIGLGQGLRQVAQIMGLTKLLATVGQDGSHRWHQARLLVAEHSENRPCQIIEWLEEGCKCGLILLRKPATA